MRSQQVSHDLVQASYQSRIDGLNDQIVILEESLGQYEGEDGSYPFASSGNDPDPSDGGDDDPEDDDEYDDEDDDGEESIVIESERALPTGTVIASTRGSSLPRNHSADGVPRPVESLSCYSRRSGRLQRDRMDQ